MKKSFIKIFALVFLSATLVSCRKEINSEQGGIDIISNVYFNASKGLDKMQTFHLSKLNYYGNNMIEIIPDQMISDIPSGAYYISDTLCYKLDKNNIGRTTLADLHTSRPMLLSKKTEGTLFLNEEIPNYKNRKNLSDTILFKKKYKRFEVNSPWSYSRFYIAKTDTILPYSMYKHAEKDYKGRLERIDSYNKKEDVFVTMQLIPRKNWDSEAKDFFAFNKYLQQSKSK